MQSIAIGLPVYRGKICAEQVYLWLDLGEAINQMKDQFSIGSFQYQDKCGLEGMRNELVYAAMQMTSSWLLMVSPNFFILPASATDPTPGVSILDMIRDAKNRNAALVAATLFPNDKKLIEVDEVPLHISAINLDFLRQNWNAPPWFMTKTDGEKFISSDTLFCAEIRKRDGIILSDARVNIGWKSKGERR